jgi:hypothetical protein
MTKPTTDLLPSDEEGLTAALLADGLSREDIQHIIRKKRNLETLPYWARLSNGRGSHAMYTVINWLHRPVHKLEYLWSRYVRGNQKARDLVGAYPTERPGIWTVLSK